MLREDNAPMFLGIDCGTQGTKTLIIDGNGTAQGRGYARHDIIERANGAREQEPEWWVEALRISVRQAVAEAGAARVSALGVSGQQHGLVVVDESYHVIRLAKLWNDTETSAQNAELVAHFGGRRAFFDRFGIVPLTGYTVSKLLWLRQKEPENFARVRHILLPHEYLNFWLTGKICAEFGDASGTGFFDVRSRVWVREVLDAIDGGTGQLFAALPPLMRADEIVGMLRAEVADDLGLPEDCVVSAGGGDNMMGAIGTGNVKEGLVTLSLGTSSTVYSFRDKVACDPTGNVAPFCASSGGWLPLVCTMNATNVVTQTLKVLGKTVDDIEEALDKTVPGSDGLIFLPFLNGERTPDLPHARGTMTGLSTSNFTPAHLIRAVIEGVSFGILDGLDLITGGEATEQVAVIGGGSRSRAWRQLLADATGALIRCPVEEEAGCLGAAIQSIVAWSHLEGVPQSFLEVAERCVKFEPALSCVPRIDHRDAYTTARELYRVQLKKAYGSSLDDVT